MSKRNARRFLKYWIAKAEASAIRMLQQFAKRLRFHRKGILSWYNNPISTGPLEGTNNKIKTLQRQAYGFRDQEFFRQDIRDAQGTLRTHRLRNLPTQKPDEPDFSAVREKLRGVARGNRKILTETVRLTL